MQTALEQELSALRQKKRYAANNLAGATWEQSISTEMQAVSEKYAIQLKGVQDRLSQLQRQRESGTK